MIEFRLAADADQFLTIAKFRALRALWARVEQACGLDAEARVHLRRDRLAHDDEARSVGEHAAHHHRRVLGRHRRRRCRRRVLPFTSALGLPDRFARRVARNAQLLLLEESNVARVADPAAGSGGIEDLTEKLCRAAWALFQEIEAAGGAPAALERGLIQDKVAKVRAEHEAATAHRKDVLTGTSDFPNLAEAPVQVLDAEARAARTARRQCQISARLSPIRLAEPFERLRDASDRMLAKTGARPKIFLANLGTRRRVHRARDASPRPSSRPAASKP